MTLELDEIGIQKELLDALKRGDKDAITEVKRLYSGMETYFHAIVFDQEMEVITLRELSELVPGTAVTISF